MTILYWTVFGSIVLCILHLIKLLYAYRSYRRFAELHHCSTLPAQKKSILHKFRLVSQNYGNLFDDYYAAKFRKYGHTHAMFDILGRPKVIHTIDPVNLHTVLVDSFEDWGVFTTKRNALSPIAHEGVLTTDGPVWHRNRKFLHRKMNTRRAKHTAAAEQDVEQFFEAIDASNGGDSTRGVDMSAMIQRMTLDMSTRHLFGVSTNLQLNTIQELKGQQVAPSEWQSLVQSYVSTWTTLRNYITLRSAMGSKYWMVDGWTYRRACARMRSFVDGFITIATERSSSKMATEGSLIDEVVQELRSPREVRQFVLELMIAGQNMTGACLEWAVAELAEHPDIYQRLRAELSDTFGLDNTHPVRPMTWDNLQSCKLLQNVINETLRCHPPVATMSRTASKDTVLPRGGGADGDEPVAVPKGATLTSNVYLVHRREEIWGEDSQIWKPDRWQGRKVGFGFVPFGAGPRTCVGRQMGLTEMSYTLARFLIRYEEIRPVNGGNNLSYQYRGILSPMHAVQIVLKKAKS